MAILLRRWSTWIWMACIVALLSVFIATWRCEPRRRALNKLLLGDARLSLAGDAGSLFYGKLHARKWSLADAGGRILGKERFQRYAKHFLSVESVELRSQASENCDADLALLIHFPETTQLYLAQAVATDEGLANLAALRNLEVLTLNQYEPGDITDAGLISLRNLGRLRTLSLPHCDVFGEAFEGVRWRSAFSLEELNLSESHLQVWGLKLLEQFQNLVQLDISQCHFLEDAQIAWEGAASGEGESPPCFPNLAVVDISGANAGKTVFGDEATTRQFLDRQPRLKTVDGFREAFGHDYVRVVRTPKESKLR